MNAYHWLLAYQHLGTQTAYKNYTIVSFAYFLFTPLIPVFFLPVLPFFLTPSFYLPFHGSSGKLGRTSLFPVGWRPLMPMAGCWSLVVLMCTPASRCLTEAWQLLMISTRALALLSLGAPLWSVCAKMDCLKTTACFVHYFNGWGFS